MSHKVRDIVDLMEAIAPAQLAESWDNVGLLLGSSGTSVSRILVTLDITAGVIRDAVQNQAEMIISHHPVLFRPVKVINDSNVTGTQVMQLLKAGIAVYCAHTNLDKAIGGTDDTLAALLGLQDVRPLAANGSGDFVQPGFGRIGKLPQKQPLERYLLNIKKALHAAGADYIGDPAKQIQIVASCAGAGGDFIELAREAGADLFVTGEVKYHEALPVVDADMALASFGHYATELPAMNHLIHRLQNSINALQYKIEVIPAKDYGNSFRVLRE